MKIKMKQPKYLLYKNSEYYDLITRDKLVEMLDKVWLRIYQDNWNKKWKDKIFIDAEYYAIIQPEIKTKEYACKNCWYVKEMKTNHYWNCNSVVDINKCWNPKCECNRPAINSTHQITIWECKEEPTLAEIIVRQLHFPVTSLENNYSDLWVLSDRYSTLERYLDEKNIKYTRFVSNVEWQDWFNKICVEIPFSYSEYFLKK